MKNGQRKLGQYLCKKWYSLAIPFMVLVGACFCISAPSTSALTTVPTKTNFQGRLTNSAGNIMPDGLYNMKFRLFTVSSGGSAVWTETRETTNRVQVTNGLFSVRLGDVTALPASLFASGELYFEVELPTPATATCSTAACGVFTEGPMTPRNQLATSAYSYNSETLDGLDSTQFARTDASNTFTASQLFSLPTSSSFTVSDGTNNLLNITRDGSSNTAISMFFSNSLNITNGAGDASLQMSSGTFSGSGTSLVNFFTEGTFRVEGQFGTLFSANASSRTVTVGATDSVGAVFVFDVKNTAGDPTGINGGTYYNSSTGKFRCYQGGAWIDCTGINNGTTQQTGANFNIDGTGTAGTAFVTPALRPITDSTTAFQIQNAAGSTNILTFDTTNARVGIGTTPSYKFHVAASTTANSGTSNIGSYLTLTSNPSSAPAATTTYYGQQVLNTSTSANLNANATLYGSVSTAQNNGTATLGASVAVGGVAQNASSGIITNAVAARFKASNIGSGSITNGVAIQASTPEVTAGSIGTAYGLLIEDQKVSGVTTGYGIWQAGATDLNVFAGKIGIGVVPSTYALEVNGSGSFSTSVLTPTLDTGSAVALNIGTANATQINLNKNVVVAASQSLTITGGNTASRPASPTEGMIYYDTTTKQLLTYANGKWQADRVASTKIVAASNSSQTAKDAADYVADGTGDQTEINSALTAAAGGMVYLMEGTYTINASVSIPNNTTLSGAGNGTIVKLANSINADIKAITNTDTTTGAGVSVLNLVLDGNKANNSSGTQSGVWVTSVGDVTANRSGIKVTNIEANSFRSYGIVSETSHNGTITGNTANNNGAGGIVLSSSGYHTITGNVTNNNTSYGVWLFATSASNIAGNTGYGNGVIGAYIQGGSNNTITGNSYVTGTQYGIYLNGSTYNTITGNTASSNSLGGIYLFTNANYNTVSSNTLYNNGGATTNNAITVNASDNNNISSNSINDGSCTTNCYGINVSTATSDTNYLNGNVLNGGTVNDAGTGTAYGGQVNSSGNFLVQPAGTIELMKNTNITGTLNVTSSVDSNGSLTIGTADQFVVSNAGVVTAGTWQGSAVAVQYGGTGLTSYTVGDLVYASGTTTLSKLAAGASGSCLTSQGASTAPAWADCEDDTLATVTARGASTSSNVTLNGTLGVTSDTSFTFSGTENLVVNSDLNAGVNLIQVIGTPSTTAGTTRGFFVQQADGVNANGLDTGVYVNNADTDLAINNAIHINNTGGGGYNNLISATTFTVTGAGAITNGTWNGGTVGVQYGGTGATSFTSGGLLYGNGTGAIQATSAGGASQCLLGGATPTWGTCNLQTAYDRSTGSTTPEIKLDSTRGGLDIQDANTTINSDLFTVRTGSGSGLGTGMFTVASTGAITSQNISDSTAAFTISRAGTSGSIFVADTTNSRVQIGNATADSTGVVLVLDTKDNAGDPTGVNGAMYYNSNSKSFRCHQDGEWRACIGGLVGASTGTQSISNTNADTTITTKNYAIPANNCVPGRVYRVTARGVYSTAALTSPSITMRVKFGTTTLATSAAAGTGSGVTNRQWAMTADVICQTAGASGTVEVAGSLSVATAAGNLNANEMLNTAAITVDTTVSQTLQLSMQWQTANANNIFVIRQVMIESLGP